MFNSNNWLLKIVAGQRQQIIQVIVCSLFINTFALISAFYIMVVYDRVIPVDGFGTLAALSIGMTFVIVFDFMMKTLRSRFIDNVGKKIDLTVNTQLFDALSQNYTYTNYNFTSDISSSVRDFAIVKEFISSASFVMFADFPFLILFAIALYMIGGTMVFPPLLICVCILLIALMIKSKLHGLSRKDQTEARSKQNLLLDILRNTELTAHLKGINTLREKWSHSAELQAKTSGESKNLSQLVTHITQSGLQISQLLIVILGVFLISVGDLSMGGLIACIIISGRMLAPLVQLTNLSSRLVDARSAYEAIDKIFTETESVKSLHGCSYINKIKGNIALRDVSLVFKGSNTPTISHASITIAPDERLAIVGPTGSGKSSLIKLACGLVKPTLGSVVYDGIDLRTLREEDLRNQVAVVHQTPLLFSESIRENILLGNPSASNDELMEAASIAGVLMFESSLPAGLDTQVFESGRHLSGGQRQCIAIARALVSDPKILFMDEPTTGFDESLELNFIKSFLPWLKNRTLILATHKASLIRLVDKMIILENGVIKAYDNKENLLKKT